MTVSFCAPLLRARARRLSGVERSRHGRWKLSFEHDTTANFYKFWCYIHIPFRGIVVLNRESCV